MQCAAVATAAAVAALGVLGGAHAFQPAGFGALGRPLRPSTAAGCVQSPPQPLQTTTCPGYPPMPCGPVADRRPLPACRRMRLTRHGEVHLRPRARTVRMQAEERPDLTADEIALLERKMGSDQKYTQKQMFREEIESPFRKTRLFLIPAFAASAALGAFIS